MILIVKSQDPPLPKVIEGEPLEKLLTAMSSCYEPESKVLNLEQFHKNEGTLSPPPHWPAVTEHQLAHMSNFSNSKMSVV